MTLDTKRLLRVGLAKAKEQASWIEGISLERTANKPIQELRTRVVTARFALAKEMLAYSNYAQRSPRPMFRLIISRSYYGMYHAMRAAAYIYYAGDDHQEHSDLPKKIPVDFPDAGVWGNQLKSAREYRNQADYDPYPRSAIYWKRVSSSVYADAKVLIPIAASYLKGKGCRL